MKKSLLILISLLSVFLFSSCSTAFQQYYIVLAVNEDDLTYCAPPDYQTPHFEGSVGGTFRCTYRLVPDSNNNISIESATTSDSSILEVIDINESNNTIEVEVKGKGIGSVSVSAKKYGSASTLPIYIN